LHSIVDSLYAAAPPATYATLRDHYDCLTFLTDYGVEDGFVAACHGVAARISPGLRFIDITHLVPPGDVRRGAAVLAQTIPYLPPAVHVTVVDPGVAPRAAASRAGGRGNPGRTDNGLLSWPSPPRAARSALQLTNGEWWAAPGIADLSRPRHLHPGGPPSWNWPGSCRRPGPKLTSLTW